MGMFALMLIIAHLIADYPLQTKDMKKSWKGLLIHTFIHMGVGFIPAIIYLYTGQSKGMFPKVIVCLLIINLLHCIIDYCKEKLNSIVNTKLKVYSGSIVCAFIYIFDQVMHCVIIIMTIQFLFEENFNCCEKVISIVSLEKGFELNTSTQILLTLIIVLLNIFFVGYLIGILLKPFKADNLVTETVMEVLFKSVDNGSSNYQDFYGLNVEDMLNNETTDLKDITAQKKITFIKDSPAKAGMWIGILERNIILILCLINSIASIGFLIAMKALTRFKQFEDKSFAEYYLIGSMLSIVFAMLSGYFIRSIW
ncbi:Protein of unknown function [Bacillus sp. OV322]|uniref:DUF3307 domain-containing protein n=1 Tax=Bacillus sp. OV322 TaxID=1882764 RepID=UPI0008E0EF9E|nr:DUF3307 domain-containing protein [Bacillus sp. OV322]SFD02139.1 Protein of unknown function [Bacillus sp. OV322]